MNPITPFAPESQHNPVSLFAHLSLIGQIPTTDAPIYAKNTAFDEHIHSLKEAIERLNHTLHGTYVLWKEKSSLRNELCRLSINHQKGVRIRGVYHYSLKIGKDGFTWETTYLDPNGREQSIEIENENPYCSTLSDLFSQIPIFPSLPLSLYDQLSRLNWLATEEYAQDVCLLIYKMQLSSSLDCAEGKRIFAFTDSEVAGCIVLLITQKEHLERYDLRISEYEQKLVYDNRTYSLDELAPIFRLEFPFVRLLNMREERVRSMYTIQTSVHFKELLPKLPSRGLWIPLNIYSLCSPSEFTSYTLAQYAKHGWLSIRSTEKLQVDAHILQEFEYLNHCSNKEIFIYSATSMSIDSKMIPIAYKEAYSVDESIRILNLPKAKHWNHLPFDKNRTKLSDGSHFLGSDVELENIQFCLTSMPNPETIDAFWHAILDRNISTVFALNNPRAEDSLADHQEQASSPFCYWEKKNYPLQLKNGWIINMEQSKQYYNQVGIRIAKRTFICTKTSDLGQTTESKIVQHYHYENWKDCCAPDQQTFDALLTLAEEERKTYPNRPMLVHCKAGLGRTGVFVVAHYLREKLQEEIKHAQLLPFEKASTYVQNLSLNFSRIVYEFRKQRRNLILTNEQFLAVKAAVFRYISQSALMPYLKECIKESIHT